MINESGVSFYPGGGHSHNGENSSLIDTSVYSIYDFPVQIVGDPSRTADQIRNLDSFKQLIIDTVNQSIIAPAGVVFQQGVINGSAHIISRSISTETIAAGAVTANEIFANTITANEIAANTITANEIATGTITADLLAANIILVGQIIQSNNYVTGVSGWAIDGNGTAEFSSASIRGAIEADTVYINSLNYWTANGAFNVGTNNNYLSYDGTNLTLTGQVNATSGAIGSWTITSTDIYNNTGLANTVLSSNGFITAGTLKIGNNDIADAEDIVATNIIKAGQFELQTGSMKGVFYTGTASSAGYGNYGFSFYWNGTNVYARIYNIATNTHQDICLSNCGSGGPTPSVSPAVSPAVDTVGVVVGTVVVGTVVVGTVVVGEPPVTAPPSGCVPPCPDGFFCIDNSYCIG